MHIRPLLLSAVILFAAVSASLAEPKFTGPAPDVLVKELYKLHDAQKGPFADTKKKAVVERFFGKELAELIRTKAAGEDGEMGALDFDALYGSQDPQIKGFKVGEVHFGGVLKREDDEPIDGLAVLDVNFKDSGKPVRIGVQCEQDAKKAWKIVDLHYSDGRSLSGILRGE
ncbi:MAG TPA: hypothetical protein VF614_10935 [Chthoniobacteraceae bacterium]|jgi:hypothetical protein